MLKYVVNDLHKYESWGLGCLTDHHIALQCSNSLLDALTNCNTVPSLLRARFRYLILSLGSNSCVEAEPVKDHPELNIIEQRAWQHHSF